MGTASRIGILYRTLGKIHSVYVHWDGYPKGVGNTLLSYYNDFHSDENLEKVKQLIQGGDLHYLESDTCLKHFKKTDDVPTVISYKEDNSYVGFYYRTIDCNGEYYYLYEHGVGWVCGDTYGSTPLSSCLLRIEDAIPLVEEYEETRHTPSIPSYRIEDFGNDDYL